MSEPVTGPAAPAVVRPGEVDEDTTTVYRVEGTGDDAWLVAEVGGCTCAGGGEWPHESHCGLEPIAQIRTLRDAVHGAEAARANEREQREADEDLLVRADSLLSLIRYRVAGLSPWDIDDLDALLRVLRPRTNAIAAAARLARRTP